MGVFTGSIRTGSARTAAGAAVAVLLVAGLAAAQSVHEIQVGGDTVTGSIGAPGEIDRIPFRLVEGSAYSLTLQAAKKSPLLLDLAVLGIDRLPDGTAGAAMKISTKGNKIVLKNLPVTETGLRYLEVRGADGTTGDWILKTKVKHQKGVLLPGSATGGGPVDLPFTCPGNATTTMAVKAARGSAALPEFVAVLDTAGAPMLVDDVAPTKTGFTVKNLLLGKPGRYTLRVGSAAAGEFSVKTKWKIPKPVKRTLLDSQIITDPILESIEPAGGDTSQTLAVSLGVDFALSGAQVVFRKTPTVITVPGSQVTVGAHEASFSVNLVSFQAGVYDVELINPDGGMDSLLQAFTVENAPPRPLGINPAFGSDNQVVRASVTGSFFQSGATVRLQRGGEVIDGTNLFISSGQISADFDLRNRTIGFWDVVVTNPGPQTATLAGAFEIRNSPPTLTSMDPRRNVDDPVVDVVILGGDFDPTPTVVLRRTGETDITGTSVVFVSGGEVHATFDTTGAAVGDWDLVLANPDLQQATLPGIFVVSGPIGSPSMVLSATDTLDAPPAVAYNGTRDEFASAWIDAGSTGSSWNVYVQRVDATGSAIGSPVSVASSSSSVQKRDASVGWDSTNDEYLVSWSELVAIPTHKSPHPSDNYSSVYQVFVQRFRASDLAKQGGNVQVTDATAFSGWNMNEFNNFRSKVVWDPKDANWKVGFMQEWSTQNINNYGYDDYDVIVRVFDPSSGSLGATSGIAYTPYHEGDTELCWDPVGQQVLVAYSARNGSDSAPMDLKLGAMSAGSVVVTSSGDNLVDPALAVDPDAGRVLLTWTRVPSSGSRTVEAVLLDRGNLTTQVGSATALGSGGGDHFLARPLYNPSTKEGLATWTRLDGSGDLTVRMRRLDTTPSTGLALLGSETEVSGGSGDEGTSAMAVNTTAGESVVFWLKTLGLQSVGSYTGSVVNGTYRGEEIWIQRLK